MDRAGVGVDFVSSKGQCKVNAYTGLGKLLGSRLRLMLTEFLVTVMDRVSNSFRENVLDFESLLVYV